MYLLFSVLLFIYSCGFSYQVKTPNQGAQNYETNIYNLLLKQASFPANSFFTNPLEYQAQREW